MCLGHLTFSILPVSRLLLGADWHYAVKPTIGTVSEYVCEDSASTRKRLFTAPYESQISLLDLVGFELGVEGVEVGR